MTPYVYMDFGRGGSGSKVCEKERRGKMKETRVEMEGKG